MSDKKKKRQEEVIESSSEEAPKKSPVRKDSSSEDDSPKARKKKTAAASSSGDGKKKKAPGLKLEHAEDGGANDPMTPRDVHDMETMAQASKTPRAMESVAKATPVVVPEAPPAQTADDAVEQTEEERKKIQPFPRIYFNVLEAKGIKPQNYFVSVAFDKEKDAWTTTTTKKKTIWEEKGRLLPIPEGAEKFRVTLYEKGLIGDMMNSKIGESIWEIASLQDGYPHQPWADLQKKGKSKAQLRVQLMYLPASADIIGDEFVTPLHALIARDKYELLVRAVDDIFADLELLDAENRSPLHLAAQVDKPKYVKLLLQKLKGEAGSILNAKKESALHTAGKFAGEDIVKQMLKAKMNVNAVTTTQQTPLHYAAEANNVAAIKALTASEDCEINAKDKDGNTPLVVALMAGSSDAVRELVKKSDLYTKNEKDLVVWEVAQRKDQVNTEPRKAFMEAVGTHDAREFLHRRNLNQKIVAKGAKCALDYEASTQFAISVSEPTEVAILITTDEVTTAPDFVFKSGFALVRSHQGEHNEPAISRDTIGFGGLKALALTLEPNFFYVVVPYSKQEDASRDYTLVVLHPKGKPVTVKQTKPWAHACVIESEWAGPTAGGAQPNRTWNENPQFEVTMPKKDDIKFCVVLSQEHNDPDLRYVDGDDHKRIPYDHNVGFYVLDRSAVKVLAQTDKWTNSRDVHQEFVMNFSERNHLCIIPAALAPGEEGPFTIKVYSDVAFSMDEK